MSQEEKLDAVLEVLARHYLEYEKVHDFYFREKVIKDELQILLAQLVQDGFATTRQINHPEINESFNLKVDQHRITQEGLNFYKTSSYKQKQKRELKKKYWSLIEKISIAVNAVLLLIIAIGGLYLSNKANTDKEENIALKQRVDSLNLLIDRLRTDTSLNFIRPNEVNKVGNTDPEF